MRMRLGQSDAVEVHDLVTGRRAWVNTGEVVLVEHDEGNTARVCVRGFVLRTRESAEEVARLVWPDVFAEAEEENAKKR